MENISVEKLGFTNRTRNALMRGKIYTLAELMLLSEEDLLKINNMGIKSVKEVLEFQERFASENDITELDEVDQVFITEAIEHPLVINCAFPEYMGKEIQNVSYRTQDGIYATDIDINELGFSVRTENGLIRANCQTINQLVHMTYEDLLAVKNLGSKSINEILDYIKKNVEIVVVGDMLDETMEILYETIVSYLPEGNEKLNNQILKILKIILAKNANEIKMLQVGCDVKMLLSKKRFIELVWDDIQIHNVYSSYIFSMISNLQNLNLLSRASFYKDIGLHDSVMKELLEAGKIEEHMGSYRVRLPHIVDWIAALDKENQRQAIIMRLNGKTLEECGQELGLTRERVRQIINKAIRRKPILREDDYKELFERYSLDRAAFGAIFQVNSQVYDYLNMVYKHGDEPIDNMVNEEFITKEVRMALEKYLNRDNILVGEEYVPCKRELLCRKLAEIICSDSDISFDEFYELYMAFLKRENLDKKENLLFPSSRAFAARMEDSSYVLMKYGRKFRYYPIEQIDIESLIGALELEQYQNVEISTLKMLNDYPELMLEYDIRDEYELHNLLKKTAEKWNSDNKYNVSINRMPLLVFGEADRKKQTEELLYQLAPISIEDFCEFYELEYGVLSRTVMANFTPYISNYYHNGMYSVNQPLFDNDEKDYMEKILNGDFYFLEDVKEEYCSRFGIDNLDRVNPRTLKELGFKVYTNYVVSDKYSNAYEYFKYFILKEDTIDMKKQDRRLTYIQIVNSTLEELRSSYQLLEYGDMQFIKLSRLQSVYPDISIEMINSYVDSAIKYSEEEKYFTIKRLKNRGFKHRLHEVGLDEWFNSGLIKNSRKVRFIKAGSSVIFYQGNRQITTTDFIHFVIKREKKIDIYEFVNLLKSEYGIILSKEKIVQFIKDTSMYYDSIMEKLYLTKEYYYEEI